ncbi:MAG TPA: flagellar hook-basal body protein [Acidobacteriota bacterium]|nr:flagellar hook-basal body protein [Acidobacteriota bacterium]
MVKGMYTSASAMLPRVRKQEMLANNIANTGTAGFKKDRMFTKELSRAAQRQLPRKTDWQKPMVDRVYIDYAPGVFDKTGNPLDLAIDGDGFFTLQAPDGGTVLTRSGAFQVDADGFLVFPGGYLVTGEGGPIEVGDGKVSISQTGEVEVDGFAVGRIVPKSVSDVSKLERLGDSLFGVPADESLLPAISASIQQGYLETSNVDVVHEMVEMLISYRTYEANAKALQSQDESLDHLFNRVAGD